MCPKPVSGFLFPDRRERTGRKIQFRLFRLNYMVTWISFWGISSAKDLGNHSSPPYKPSYKPCRSTSSAQAVFAAQAQITASMNTCHICLLLSQLPVEQLPSLHATVQTAFLRSQGVHNKNRPCAELFFKTFDSAAKKGSCLIASWYIVES